MATDRANISAMHLCNEAAERLATHPQWEAVRERIVDLFVREKQTPLCIAAALDGQLGLPSDVTVETAASAVRRAVNLLVDPGTLRSIRSDFHAESLKRSQAAVGAKRDEWMREHGMHVWTHEETEMLLRFHADGARSIREAAQMMCDHFEDLQYTYERCKRRLRHLQEQSEEEAGDSAA